MISAATILTLRIPCFEAVLRKASDERLHNRPVVIVTSFKPLGRVVAACPLALAQGVREEMPYPAAKVGCPDAAFFPPDRQLSARMAQQLLLRAEHYSPLVEAASNGCVLLDTQGTEKLWGNGYRVAEMLIRDVESSLNMTAAAGLACRRPWSLLASRAAGGTGVCHIPPGEEDEFLDRVPADWVDGLLPRTRGQLLEMNIRTLGQLRDFGRMELARQFGDKCGEALWQVLHPPDWEPMASPCGRPAADLRDNAIRVDAAMTEVSVDGGKLRVVARDLAGQVAATLRLRNLGTAKLRLTLLHTDGAVKSAEGKTGGYVQAEGVLMATAEMLLARAFRRRVRVIRMWMEAEKLAPPARQGVLFQDGLAAPAAAERLLTAVDGIRKRYGERSVESAALLQGRKRSGAKMLPLQLFPVREGRLLESG